MALSKLGGDEQGIILGQPMKTALLVLLALAKTVDGAGWAAGGCTDYCAFASDGACDDGGPGMDFSICGLGTDCTDCGLRIGPPPSYSPGAAPTAPPLQPSPPSPPPAPPFACACEAVEVTLSGRALAAQSSKLGTYVRVDGTMMGGRAVYKKSGSSNVLWFFASSSDWSIDDFADGSYGLKSVDNLDTQCPEAAGTWLHRDGSAWESGGVAVGCLSQSPPSPPFSPPAPPLSPATYTVLTSNNAKCAAGLEVTSLSGCSAAIAAANTAIGTAGYGTVSSVSYSFHPKRCYSSCYSNSGYFCGKFNTHATGDGSGTDTGNDKYIHCHAEYMPPSPPFSPRYGCACAAITIVLSHDALAAQPSRAGAYLQTGLTQGGRAVYQQEGGSEYLYYRLQAWKVGPDYTGNSAGLISVASQCPEGAGTWNYASGGQWQSGGIEVACSYPPGQAPPPKISPPPLPPAPSPPPPFSKGTVVLTLTASGSVSDFSDNDKSSLQQKVADAAGVDKLLVTIRVAAASVLITVNIAVPAFMTAYEVQTSLSSTLGTADAASAVLGLTVEGVPTTTHHCRPSVGPRWKV